MVVILPLLGQCVPVLENFCAEQFSPNTQSKPSLVQLEAVTSYAVAGYLRKESDSHLATTFFQRVVWTKKSPLSLPFSWLNNPSCLSPFS